MSNRGSSPHCYFVVGIRSNFRGLLKDAIETAKRYGYVARILDIHQIVSGWEKHPNDWDEVGLQDEVVLFSTTREFGRFVAKNVDHESPVLFLYPPDRFIRKFWFKFQRRKAPVGLVTIGPVPSLQHCSQAGLMGLRKILFLMLRPLKALFKPSLAFWVVSGTACTNKDRRMFRSWRSAQLIYAHSIDYELFRLMSMDSNNLTRNDGRVVLLDQGWFSKPLPEYYRKPSIYPPTTYDNYRRGILDFLARIEKHTDCPVVIGCHPKADLAETQRLYEGYEVVRGATKELVARASMVVANSTTSIQFAVLFRKPILLFTSDELETSVMAPLVAGYQHELGLELVNIDRLSGVSEIIDRVAIDEERYGVYINRYIKQDASPQLPLWEIVFQGLAKSTGGPLPSAT